MFIKEEALKKLCYMLWQLDLSAELKARMIKQMDRDFLRIYRDNPDNFEHIELTETVEDSGLDEPVIIVENDHQKTDVSYDEVMTYLARKIEKNPFDFSRLLTDAKLANQQQITRNDRETILAEVPETPQITALDEQTVDHAVSNIEADDECTTKPASKKRGIPRKEEKELLLEAEYFTKKTEKTNLNKFFSDNRFNQKQKIGFALDRLIKTLPYEAYRSKITPKDWALFISEVKANENYISEIRETPQLGIK